jgi:hypothetical protein
MIAESDILTFFTLTSAVALPLMFAVAPTHICDAPATRAAGLLDILGIVKTSLDKMRNTPPPPPPPPVRSTSH